MKKVLLFFIVLTLIGCSPQNQSLDLNKNSLLDYFEREKEYTGGKILSSEFFIIKDKFELTSYIRSDNSVPDVDLIVRYIYHKKDSIIKIIRNEWDISNHNKKLNNKKDLRFRSDLLKFYEILENNLQGSYGKGNVKGNIPREINNKDTYLKEIKWLIGNTIIELNILMSNTYEKKKNIFPTHRIYLSYKVINSKDKPDYEITEFIKKNRKKILNIEYPIRSSLDTIFSDCENSDDKIRCMNNKVRDLIIQRIKKEKIQIKNDTLKMGYSVQIDGRVEPLKNSIKSNNKKLEKLALDIIENLPIITPFYSEKMRKNVYLASIFFVIIKNNEVVNYE
ncbi:MAG: hypothetical protein HRT66_09770 [Flavobacteriaceae bacterium]|nr:hypothetical protein [Flavobacteriaceae bacterium]